MDVRKDDISRVLMDSQDEWLSGFREIPPNAFDPLALLEFVQRYNVVMGRRFLPRYGVLRNDEFSNSRCPIR
jgi:hypothetical protein